MGLLINLLANAVALLVTSWLLSSGIHVFDFKTALLAAIILGLVNTFIKPILLFLTAPLNFLTLGLFTFVINALMLLLVSAILGSTFRIDSFWWALLGAAVLSVVSTVLSTLVKDLGK